MKFTTGKILTSAIGNDKVIYIPEGFTHIDEYVFNENIDIEKVIMPTTVKNIGRYAFCNCPNLREVVFNNKIEQIDEGAFSKCNNIKKINIPGTIRNIGDYAFGDCYKLEKIIIENSGEETAIEYIGLGAFMGCVSLTNVEINKKVEDMGKGIFKNCKQLEKITFPYITEGYVPEKCFEACTKLKHIKLSDNIDSVYKQAFAFCTNLQEIVLPKKIRNIGERAFWGCYSLEKINLQQSIDFIGIEAFRGCNKLKNL